MRIGKEIFISLNFFLISYDESEIDFRGIYYCADNNLSHVFSFKLRSLVN